MLVLFVAVLALMGRLRDTEAVASFAQPQSQPESRQELPSSQYSFDTIAEDVLQCNPRTNSFFAGPGLGEQGVGECLRRRAVTHLLDLATARSSVGLSPSLTLVASEEAGSRGLPHYAEPPSVLEAMRVFLGHRVMRWQLDALYPGLVMRLGPMGVPDAGLLEFVLERLYDDTDRAIGPGRLLVKRTVLPLLLGFKLKLSTLMPILLAGFFMVASKALFFGKLAVLFGAMIALKAVLFGGAGLGAGLGVGHVPPLVPHGHSSGLGLVEQLLGSINHNYHQYGPVSFKSAADREVAEALDPSNDNIPREAKSIPNTATGGRNFAWEEADRRRV